MILHMYRVQNQKKKKTIHDNKVRIMVILGISKDKTDL